jgi:excinuclease ABC subunit A
VPPLDKKYKHDIDVVVDRIVVRDDIAARLADSLETCLRLADGLAVAEFADKPLPKNLGRRARQQVAQRNPRADRFSRRSSPARSPASPSRDRAAAVFVQQPVRAPARPAMAWAPRRIRPALIVPRDADAAPGRHRALGQVHLALLHADAGSARKHYGFKLSEPPWERPAERCRTPSCSARDEERSTSSMTTACAPTRPPRPSRASSQHRAPLAETDSPGCARKSSATCRPPLPGLQWLPAQARGAGGQGQWPAHRRRLPNVDPQCGDWFDELPDQLNDQQNQIAAASSRKSASG